MPADRPTSLPPQHTHIYPTTVRHSPTTVRSNPTTVRQPCAVRGPPVLPGPPDRTTPKQHAQQPPDATERAVRRPRLPGPQPDRTGPHQTATASAVRPRSDCGPDTTAPRTAPDRPDLYIRCNPPTEPTGPPGPTDPQPPTLLLAFATMIGDCQTGGLTSREHLMKMLSSPLWGGSPKFAKTYGSVFGTI